jgi:hypothetical protein
MAQAALGLQLGTGLQWKPMVPRAGSRLAWRPLRAAA